MSNIWSATVGNDVAFRRASGRRSYNSLRQGRAWARQGVIIEQWCKSTRNGYGGGRLFDWGGQAALARQLGVSRATISRDIKKIQDEIGQTQCPTCDGLVSNGRWRRLEQVGRVRIKTPERPRRRPKPVRDTLDWSVAQG